MTTPENPKALTASVEELGYAISELHKSLEELAARLTPIVSSEPPESEEQKCAATPVHQKLSEKVYLQIERVRILRNGVNETLRLLEI